MDTQFLCGKHKQHHKTQKNTLINYGRKGISLSVVGSVSWRDGDQIKLKAVLLSLSARWPRGAGWQSLSQVPPSTPTRTSRRLAHGVTGPDRLTPSGLSRDLKQPPPAGDSGTGVGGWPQLQRRSVGANGASLAFPGRKTFS